MIDPFSSIAFVILKVARMEAAAIHTEDIAMCRPAQILVKITQQQLW